MPTSRATALIGCVVRRSKCSDRLPGYYALMSNPKIFDAVESLIGGEIFANPVYNVRPKVPKVAAGAVPWHQD